MPKICKELTAVAVRALKKDGVYQLGGVPGLQLVIHNGADTYRYRYSFGEKRRVITFGIRKTLSLSEARDRAREFKQQVLNGIDPLEYKKEQKQKIIDKQREETRAKTFRTVAEKWIEDRAKNNFWRNDVRGEKVTRSALLRYVYPVFGEKNINSITPEDVRDMLAPTWQSAPSTSKKVLCWVRAIFRWAIAMRIRTNRENPASLVDALGVLMEPLNRHQKPRENFAALPFQQIPEFMAALADIGSPSADMVQLSILLCARSKAIRLAQWSDVDFEKKTLTVRLENDKIKLRDRDRTLYLSTAAVALIQNLKRLTESPYLFCNPYGRPLSVNASVVTIKRMHLKKKEQDGIGWIDEKKSRKTGQECIITMHGTARAGFRTWAKDDVLGNNIKFDQEAVEKCLLHSTKDMYHGAYDRAEFIAERKLIMEEWGKFCTSKLTSLHEGNNNGKKQETP